MDKQSIKQHGFWWLIIIGCDGFIVGLIYLWLATNQVSALPQDTFRSQSLIQTQSINTITVAVSGAVKKPGVFVLSQQSRLIDAIAAADGFSYEVDRIQVAKNINGASRLIDEQHIYIPFKEKTTLPSKSANYQNQLISINTATQTELESLPGIGSKRAVDIIQNRPFSSLNELITNSIISESVWSDIQGQIRL